ncbi:MAG: hypothetical protein HYW91_00390 [Candidatus Sungbacteria bacterium]|nr:hypothetical protein [Candidatus Sungbacteria bacterium]
MRLTLALIILSVLLGMGIFGFAGISCEAGAGAHCCLAEIINLSICPSENPLAVIDFHFGALQSFSTATIDAGVIAAFLVLAVFTLVFSAALFSMTPDLHIITRGFWETLPRISASARVESLSWLALHENSPAIF